MRLPKTFYFAFAVILCNYRKYYIQWGQNVKWALIKWLKVKLCLPVPLFSVYVAGFLPLLFFYASPEDSTLCSYSSSSCSCLSLDSPLFLKSHIEVKTLIIQDFVLEGKKLLIIPIIILIYFIILSSGCSYFLPLSKDKQLC